jgi:hypothetical protein
MGWIWLSLYETYVILCAGVAILGDILKFNLMGSFTLQPQSSQYYANNQRVKSMCISAYSLMPYFSLLLPYTSFIFYTC